MKIHALIGVSVSVLSVGFACADVVPKVEQASMDDCAPVISWTVPSGADIESSVVQMSYSPDRDYADLSPAFEGAGTFAFTNVAAKVGLPTCYRIRIVANGGETFSAAVTYRRLRQLERSESDQTKLNEGVAILEPRNYTTDTQYYIIQSADKAFDGSTSTFCDICQKPSYGAAEVVLGVKLPEPAHITDIWLYPRTDTVDVMRRSSYARMLAAQTDADYAAANVIKLADQQMVNEARWYHYVSTDTESLYKYVFAYDGPLEGGLKGFSANLSELRFYGWTLGDEAEAGLTVAEPSATWMSMEDTTPVVSWTVKGDFITSSKLQYAFLPEGPYVDLGEVKSGVGRFSYHHDSALVGVTVYYRVAYASRRDGEGASVPLRYTRVRQLDRAETDQTKLRSGVTVLDGRNYTTEQHDYWGVGTEVKAFDGQLGTTPDLSKKPSYGAAEVSIGVRLPDSSHITDIFLYPRSDSLVRSSVARVLACADDAAYAAKTTKLLMSPHVFSAAEWYHVEVPDGTAPCQYVFAYDGPLEGGLKGFYGNMAEIRLYGWSKADEIEAGLYLKPPTVERASMENTAPVVTWSVPLEVITSSQLECSYSSEGPFRPMGSEHIGVGTVVWTNNLAAAGLPAYYRIRYVSMRDGVLTTEATAYRRVRQLERADSDQKMLLPGVTVLPGVNYSEDNPNAKGGTSSSKAFDGDIGTSPDMYVLPSYGPCETLVGVRLPEAAHISDVCFYPRGDSVITMQRSGNAYMVACSDDADYEAKAITVLTRPSPVTELRWYQRLSTDTSTTFQYVFAYSGPLAGGTVEFCGNVSEIRLYGWMDSDESNAKVHAPEGVCVRPALDSVRLSWQDAINAEAIRIERRVVGSEDWIVVANDVDPASGTYEDRNLTKKTAYEYRVVSIGLGGYMEATAEIETKTLAPGLLILVH